LPLIIQLCYLLLVLLYDLLRLQEFTFYLFNELLEVLPFFPLLFQFLFLSLELQFTHFQISLKVYYFGVFCLDLLIGFELQFCPELVILLIQVVRYGIS